jgi:hypothetical protein
MPTCSNCGATVRESARFCTSCGTRLNEPTEPTTSDWSTTPEPAATDSSSPVVETSIWESIRQEVTAGSSEPAGGSTGNNAGAATYAGQEEAAEEETVNEESFTWSWNTPIPSDDDGDSVAPPVDDESSVLIDSEEPGEPAEEAADLTEIEILDDSAGVSDVVAGEEGIATGESDDEEPLPDNPEVDESLESSNDDFENQETLAAWATQWNTPADSLDAVGGEPASVPNTGSDNGVDAEAPEVVTAFDPNATVSDTTGAEEDTVTKAERLIGELRAIIPALARPKPAQPALSSDPKKLASDLDNAATLGDWDDLRKVLLDARDNPRDIDNMLKLASNVDQMLELLDDRNNLAKTATSIAAQLRQPADRSGVL